MTTATKRMLTAADVADELAVSVEHVRRFIRRGDLAAINIATSGRPNYRITRTALDEYLRDHAVAS
ncbi:MAG TPA: helix-turn-helix domain-containing protein [Mycobacterium sp.]|jgi:excisionase family DNA binding protein|uniref:helix-turn-helix domain-containing protein n=1 Tax=Mycobacterium sp. TaxID=1785 RepID=UPI002F414C10